MNNQHPTPMLSIVIPCYNQGVYLKDALDGLEAPDKGGTEVIIINDGSADEFTNRYLRELADEGSGQHPANMSCRLMRTIRYTLIMSVKGWLRWKAMSG
jgi:glycosyltransferase involved in cell wall biosynthesis